ncbi:DUF1583 domain-containing protein [Thalassoroseus pseudoceratinae]|uniref:DUF1583 domain-containing protein n=1 Tax=Thalassoroseus pseudoceratinae TaxID=2713176 RepID=UPI001420B1B8|nr:DUF1583 domain-containing protein [Thalassoroseus pseudoceratinae]
MRTKVDHTIFYQLRLTVSIVVWGGILFANTGLAADRSDLAVRAELFGDENLDNSWELQRRTAKMSPVERYPLLRDAVFPPERSVIRVQIDFAPTDQPETGPTVVTPEESLHLRLDRQLIAPVRELVACAQVLNRLDELEALVATRRKADPSQVKEALTVEILIAIARQEFERTRDLLVTFYNEVSTTPVMHAERGPETVVLWSAARMPELRQNIADLVFQVYEQARNGQGPRSERWHRQVYAMKYLLQWDLQDETTIAAANPPGENPLDAWIPVSRAIAGNVAKGFPHANWIRRPGLVAHVGGHDRDYLCYRTPLLGDFVVEADISAFNYRDTRLGYGGTWAGPGYDHTSILNGHFDDDRPSMTLKPRLDEISEPMRVRLVVRNGERITEVNGREVFRADVSQSNPWVTIMGYWYTHGWVKNLRILGDPVIPEEIELLSDDRLLGWLSYYDESIGQSDSDWRLVDASKFGDATANGKILQGDCDPENRGSFQESLLRYHRPMIEDGTISYEFFYEADRFAIHPALDRTAFLIHPEGVSLHTIGDWPYDRTGLDPANATLVNSIENVSGTLPLKPRAWNRLEFTTVGQVVSIRLNGTPIFKHTLSESNRRKFGLFHYADQTEARVRNIRWRGDWPQEIPAPTEQQLANDHVEKLLAKLDLPKTFRHDFANGLPVERFLMKGEGWQKNSMQLDDGLQLVRPGLNSYVRYEIIPHLQLSGDFDIVAEFEGFDASITEGGDGNIQLFVGFEDLSECRFYRKFSRFEKKELGQQIIQAAYFYLRNGERQYAFPKKTSDATNAGKLRFVRIGDRMHYLFAAENSENYRLLYTETVPTASTRPSDFRLILETTKPGQAQVVWKSLTVRAEELTGAALHSVPSIQELDEHRKTLQDKHTLDLSDAETVRRIPRWGSPGRYEVGDDGLTITQPGFASWRGSGLSLPFVVSGDFDYTVELDVQKIEAARPGGECTAYLEVVLSDPEATLIQSKFAISSTGYKAGELQVRHPKGNEHEYQELASVPFEQVHQLRIVRRGMIAYFLFQETVESQPVLLGLLEVPPHPVKLGNLRTIVHTGGADRETVVLLKSATIAADRLESPVVPVQGNR